MAMGNHGGESMGGLVACDGHILEVGKRPRGARSLHRFVHLLGYLCIMVLAMVDVKFLSGTTVM